MIRNSFILVALVLLTAACAKSPEQEQKQAIEAQQKADEIASEARSKASETVNEAQREADQKGQQAINEANQDIAKAQANANETIRDANQDLLKARNDLREEYQKKLDALSNKIDDTVVKAQKANAKAQADFNTAMVDVTARRNALGNDLKNLGTQTDVTIENAKLRFDQQLTGLEQALDNAKRGL